MTQGFLLSLLILSVNGSKTIYTQVIRVSRMTDKIIPKFGTHEMIQFVGVSELAPEEQALVSKLSTEQYEKIKRLIPNIEQMVVHIKHYEKEGEKKKFSLHIRVKAPTQAVIESCKSHDFDLARALHKAFDDVRTQIEHRFHIGTRSKAYE
jgi:ribosome-associated translation inhibitor RaiA